MAKPSMTDQAERADKPTTTMIDVVTRLRGNVDNLESTLEQLLTALRKRGVQPNIDITAIVRAVRRDVDAVGQTVAQSSTRALQFQELVRTLSLINSSLELGKVLEEVMDTVVRLTGAERGYLMLLDRNTGELEVRTARNWDRETLTEGESIFSRGIVNAAITSKETILTTNAQDDPRFQGMQSVMNNSLRSIVCVPLSLRGQVVGVLYADNQIGKGVFNPESLPTLGAFANQAAIAIENAQAFGRVKAELAKAEEEVRELRIMIDEGKRETQIKEITNTEYFKELEAMVKTMRRNRES
jgi:transcriptional regulator with GAF, ATPase, and Fis domain